MHKSPKPVRKCHSCKLNLRDHCGVYPNPHGQWQSGKCPGFRNEEMYQNYLEDLEKHPPDQGKQRRRTAAKLARTNHPPSFMPGFRVPKR